MHIVVYWKLIPLQQVYLDIFACLLRSSEGSAMSNIATFIPLEANPLAIDAPIPFEPPVTTATSLPQPSAPNCFPLPLPTIQFARAQDVRSELIWAPRPRTANHAR